MLVIYILIFIIYKNGSSIINTRSDITLYFIFLQYHFKELLGILNKTC